MVNVSSPAKMKLNGTRKLLFSDGMKLPLLKTADQIAIVETRNVVEEGVLQSSETRNLSLEIFLNDFLLKLGQSNFHVLGVVIQLLTRSKVRVDFRDYNIRLELGAGEKPMERPQAVAVFDDYILRSQKSDGDKSAELTQKIMVQAPRISLPKARPS
jgi:hypothetical protein